MPRILKPKEAAGGGSATAVVILTKNSARTLRPCLDGLKASTVRPAEVIIVDGGSTDGTLEMAREYGGALNIRILYDEGRGLGYARDIGWRAAGSRLKYVTMVDSDVVVDPGFFAMAMKLMDADEGLGAIAGKLRPECREPGLAAKFQVLNLSMYLHMREPPYPARTPAVHTAFTMFRRSAMEEVGGFSSSYRLAKEDSYISFRLRDAGYRLSLVNVYARHLETGRRFWRVNFRYGRSYAVIAKDFPREAPLWTIKNRAYAAAVLFPMLQAFIMARYLRRYMAETGLRPAESLEMAAMETVRQGLRSSGMIYQFLKGGID